MLPVQAACVAAPINGFLVIDDVFPPQDVELLREAAASPEVMRDWRKTEHATTTVHLLEIAVKHPLMMELTEPRRIRTVDPQLKRLLLYRLS